MEFGRLRHSPVIRSGGSARSRRSRLPVRGWVATAALVGCAWSTSATSGTVSAGESLAGLAGVPGGASVSSVAPGTAAGGIDGSLPIIRTTLYDATRLFTGSTLDRVELSVPSEGTLFITVKDMAFPVLTGSLSFALVEGGVVLEEKSGPGSLEHVTTGPALLFAFVQSTATPGLGIGSYHLNIAHEAVIPLPATLWLLIGGLSLAGFSGRVRRRSGPG